MPLLFFYLLYLHCHLFAPSARETWPLLRDANPMRFAVSPVLWLSKQRGSSTPGHKAPQAPGTDPRLEAPVGWGCVCFLCVHTGQLGLCCWKRAWWLCRVSSVVLLEQPSPSPPTLPRPIQLPGSTHLPQCQPESQCWPSTFHGLALWSELCLLTGAH